MERVIKFRGQRVDNKEWVYGYYAVDLNGVSWIFNTKTLSKPFLPTKVADNHEVIPETVGQFTGLTDKNRVEIYEDDALSYKRQGREMFDLVEFDKGAFYCGLHNGSSTRKKIKLIQANTVRVIGNIHDDPDVIAI